MKTIIVVIMLLVSLIGAAVVNAYPSHQERCLASFGTLLVSAIGENGEISYLTEDNMLVIYSPNSDVVYFGDGHERKCDSIPAWQPGALEIVLAQTSDCSLVEIDNLDGGWSTVTNLQGEPILLHYGESLFVYPDGITDKDRYRAVPTECY